MRIFLWLVLFISVNAVAQPVTLYGLKTMKLIPGNGIISSFYMDETPVTYEDFILYVRAGGLKNAYWLYDSYNIPVQPSLHQRL